MPNPPNTTMVDVERANLWVRAGSKNTGGSLYQEDVLIQKGVFFERFTGKQQISRMGSSMSAWIIYLELIVTVTWLIKSITVKPQVIRYESQILREGGVQPSVPQTVVMPISNRQHSKQKRGRRSPRRHAPSDCLVCHTPPHVVDHNLLEAERIARVIPYPQLKSNRGRRRSATLKAMHALIQTAQIGESRIKIFMQSERHSPWWRSYHWRYNKPTMTLTKLNRPMIGA